MTVVINGTTGITSVNGTAAAPSVTGTDTDTGIVYGTNTLSLATGGTTAVTVDSSQNVGIGTSSPTAKLQIGTSSTTGAALASTSALEDYSSTSQLRMLMNWGGSGKLGIGAAGSSGMIFGTATNITGAVSTEWMRIDSSGNLGVGLTSIPNAQGNSIAVGNTSGANINITCNGVAGSAGAPKYLDLRFLGYNNEERAKIRSWDEASTSGNGNLTFWTGAAGSTAERARIDSSGNLLVGKTSNSPTSIGWYTQQDGTTVSTLAASTAGTNTYLVYSTGASAFRFYVGMEGKVYCTSTTITGISDQRLKENIRDLDDGLEKVMALQPRKFDWKEGKGKGIANDRGFIAQEFEQVFPDMIDEWLDPAPEGEEPYKAVNANLVPTLVKAIQEQQAIIQQLQADVAALKGQA